MSSVPNEILLDILQPLDRWTLDYVQFANRRFLQLILVHMSHTCLRHVSTGRLGAPRGDDPLNPFGTWSIHVEGLPKRQLRYRHRDAAVFFAEFMRAMRSSCVDCLILEGLVFTPELAVLLLQTPIVAIDVRLYESSFSELTSTVFRKVLLQFSPTDLNVSTSHLRASQITDELLQALRKSRVRRTEFKNPMPVDGSSFFVTDDTIVDFCMAEDVQISRREGGAAPERMLYEELVVFNGTFTTDLFKRLIEASSASVRTQPLRIKVSPLRFEDEDLRDYAQHLSYRDRVQPWQQRIYDFPGEQLGAVAPMHLQIVLCSGTQLKMTADRRAVRYVFSPASQLVMVRARRPHDWFYESDE